MPNLDGGHYFLTLLAPIRSDPVPIGDDRYRSPVTLLRETLARLPTARQTATPCDAPDASSSALNSPFARNRLNHLARFVVIDDVVFNGRVSGDALADRVHNVNPIIHRPVDGLRCSYLLFGADIDAPGDGEAAFRAYTDELWATMREELVEVFQYCVGFEQVKDAAGLHRYLTRCRVETTMPFNDYWIDPLPARSFPFQAAGAIGVLVLVGLVIVLLKLGWGLLWTVAATLLATGALLVLAYHGLIAKGQDPFPTAPDSDLPSILKALYLQQRFTRFAIENQGVDAETLHRRFAAFVTEHRPTRIDEPTQAPGVISS